MRLYNLKYKFNVVIYSNLSFSIVFLVFLHQIFPKSLEVDKELKH